MNVATKPGQMSLPSEGGSQGVDGIPVAVDKMKLCVNLKRLCPTNVQNSFSLLDNFQQ